MPKGYKKDALTGGGATALDLVSVDDLSTGDLALTDVANVLYFHRFDADRTDAESSPEIIRPDDYVDGGVWVLGPGPEDEIFEYGAMTVTGNTTVVTTSDTTYRKITDFDTTSTAICSVLCDPTTDNDIEVFKAGDYEIALSVSIETDTSKDKEIFIAIAKNGTALVHSEQFIKKGGEPETLAVYGIYTLAANDKITAQQKVSASISDLYITDACLSVRRVGA